MTIPANAPIRCAARSQASTIGGCTVSQPNDSAIALAARTATREPTTTNDARYGFTN